MMTEKIFKYIIDVEYDPETGEEKNTTVLKTDKTYNIENWETLVFAMYTHHGVFESLVSELNKLNDDNEQLKDALNELKEIGDYQVDRIKELTEENEELKEQVEFLMTALKLNNEITHEIVESSVNENKKLQKENEQLKQQLKELKE